MFKEEKKTATFIEGAVQLQLFESFTVGLWRTSVQYPHATGDPFL